MKDFNSLCEDTYKTMLGTNLNENNDKYVKDTIKYIEDILKNVDDKGAEKFLNGLKDFLDKNEYLTPKQVGALGKFAPGAPDSAKK